MMATELFETSLHTFGIYRLIKNGQYRYYIYGKLAISSSMIIYIMMCTIGASASTKSAKVINIYNKTVFKS